MIGSYLHSAIRTHYENYLLHEWEFEFLRSEHFFISYCSKQAENTCKNIINKQKDNSLSVRSTCQGTVGREK